MSAEGTLSLPAQGKGEANDPEAQKARQQLGSETKGFQDRINAALKAAQEASDQGHNALVRLSANTLDPSRANGSLLTAKYAVDGIMRDLHLVDPYIPDGKDPAKNAAWWNSLTLDQQETYLTLNAAQVGDLDGIPAEARDRANRLVLDQKIDALEAGSASVFGLDQKDYDKRKNALMEIRKKLEEGANEKEESKRMFLLAIGPERFDGDGRAIVATGNPDKGPTPSARPPRTRAACTPTSPTTSTTKSSGRPGTCSPAKASRSPSTGRFPPGILRPCPSPPSPPVTPRAGTSSTSTARRATTACPSSSGPPA
ncbi:hypothetical protein ACIQOW_28880 [Kitasatospora sp. NPDC091335]|uniref:hypothetical protein n=1 Tax=Kitasatospora sp. NPDC091335 TaxID=3364085 RepID=UPI003804215F